MSKKLDYNGISIEWLNHHAAFKLKKEVIVYIDPWDIADDEPADYIIITHPHYDHLSPDDVKKIQTEKTKIITVQDCAEKLSGEIQIVKPGDVYQDENIHIAVVPAYNINKEFHPKENDWVGVIVKVGEVFVYHAGDTDIIPAMENIDCHVALLPVGGKYTMNGEEAGKAANIIKPEILVPMHWGKPGEKVIGSREDAEDCKKIAECKTVILD